MGGMTLLVLYSTKRLEGRLNWQGTRRAQNVFLQNQGLDAI